MEPNNSGTGDRLDPTVMTTKAYYVVESCQTMEQIDAARNWLDLFYKSPSTTGRLIQALESAYDRKHHDIRKRTD